MLKQSKPSITEEEIDAIIKQYIAGMGLTVFSSPEKWSFEDIFNTEYKLLLDSDYYKPTGSKTIDGETFTADSTYYSKTTFALDDIQTVQYIASFDGGLRISGFGSAKLELGNFENEKYKYLSYRYVGTDACVALFTKHGIIVFNQPTEEATKALYDELMEKTVK
jgi:hypothetical protein